LVPMVKNPRIVFFWSPATNIVLERKRGKAGWLKRGRFTKKGSWEGHPSNRLKGGGGKARTISELTQKGGLFLGGRGESLSGNQL